MTGAAAPGELRSSREPWRIRGARIVRPASGTVETADAVIAEGTVVAVGRGLERPRGARDVDASGRWLFPGWIDLQLNDLAWAARGPREPDAHAARVAEVSEHQARRGVTGFILATVASPIDDLLGYLRGLRAALDRPAGPAGTAFLGALVEGTFMNPACHGAHNPRWVLPPEPDALERILDTGAVRLINIAPETAPGAIECIRRAAARGTIVGVGHARPSAERLREAVAAGTRYAIHLGNGPTGSSLKAFRDGGMLEECLRNDDLVATIILDGVHVHPQLVRDWIERKEASRVIAISDGAFAAGAPPGEFEVHGVRGRLSEDGTHLRVVPAGAPAQDDPGLSSDSGALFGSAAGMREVFESALNLLTREMPGVYRRRHAALPIEEAALVAARLCSWNAARLLGEGARGSIEPGMRGDLVLVDVDGGAGAHRVRVEATWLA